MSCSGQMIAVGTPSHHACMECGHRTGSHALQSDGIVTCDMCSILDALGPTTIAVLDLIGQLDRHLSPPQR